MPGACDLSEPAVCCRVAQAVPVFGPCSSVSVRRKTRSRGSEGRSCGARITTAAFARHPLANGTAITPLVGVCWRRALRHNFCAANCLCYVLPYACTSLQIQLLSDIEDSKVMRSHFGSALLGATLFDAAIARNETCVSCSLR